MEKKTTEDNKESLLYVLWGYDAFSGESYKCGMYRHRSSANRAMRKRKEEVKDQAPIVRDTFSISVLTESSFLEMQMEELKEIATKYKIWINNQAFINNNAPIILQNLKELVANKKFESYVKEYIGDIIDCYERPLVSVPDDMYIESIFLQVKESGRHECSFCLGMRIRDIPYAESDEILSHIKRGTFDDFKKEINKMYTTKKVCDTLNLLLHKAIYG